MVLFSERNGYIIKPLQYKSMTLELRNRLWNTYKCEIHIDNGEVDSRYLEQIMDLLGLNYDNGNNEICLINNLARLKSWYDNVQWYKVFDFVETYLNFLPYKDRDDAIENFNSVLEQENAAYRIVGATVLPITNDSELQSIFSAQTTKYNAVSTHMQKAAELFSRRPIPDHENSIKEAISAIESLCCIITEDKGATLGKALEKLEDKGIHLHKALLSSMRSLYGYTSDEGGIRHGSIVFAGVSSEDAKYMLVSCSAFVNYLIEKWEKVK